MFLKQKLKIRVKYKKNVFAMDFKDMVKAILQII